MTKLRDIILLFLLLIIPFLSWSQDIYPDFMQPFPLIAEDNDLKAFIIDSVTKSPVSYARIHCSDTNEFTRTNEKGAFRLTSVRYPVVIKIQKFGYKEKALTIKSPQPSININLTPAGVFHKADYRIRLQYAGLLKKAAEKLRVDPVAADQDQLSRQELVYCRIAVSVDSIIRSLYESYAKMDLNKSSIQGFQSEVGRYAPLRETITGVTGNRLSFSLDAYTKMLPLRYLERFVKNEGYFEQDGQQIVIARLKNDGVVTDYYIRTSDTSIVCIKRGLNADKPVKLKENETFSTGKRNNLTEVYLSPSQQNRKYLRIDFIAEKESFELLKKDRPTQVISKTTIYSVIADSALINERIKDYQFRESLVKPDQQLNFRGIYSLSKKGSPFENETQKLLLRPYSSSFWESNSLIIPQPGELGEIKRWEQGSRFYSGYHVSPRNETTGVDSVVSIMNRAIIPVENVYIETDRNEYMSGDTIWFSAFALDNLSMDSTSMSKVLYVDLINPENKIDRHLKLFIKNGRSKGDFTIDKKSKNGIYRVRAYTQWMRNFQNEYLFEKEIPVYRSEIENLISFNPVITKGAEGDSVSLFINILLPPGYNSVERQLDLDIKLNDSISIKERIPFRGNYNEAFNFYIPSAWQCSFADVKLTVSDTAYISEQRLAVPLKSAIDLQFFPESGKMIAGMSSVIAFKAADKKGNPTEFEADITDGSKIITHITVDKTGVGKFSLTPLPDKSYSAVVNSPGSKYVIKLPVTEPRGYILSYNLASNTVSVKNNYLRGKHYLLASVRGAVYHALELKLDSGDLQIRLPFNKYPKGIVQVTLTDSLFHPLAERLVFNNRPDQKMKISIESEKREYNPGEHVNLLVKVTDAHGKPVESYLSLAVIDGSKADSLRDNDDIESYLYLTAELKGKIDYQLLNLSDTTSEGKQKTDLLMMTQGWRNYLWNSIRYSNALKESFPNEKSFFVTGKIFNFNSKRTAGDYTLNFFDKSNGYNDLVGVNNRGGFRIDFPYFYETHDLFIQNRNIKGKIDDVRFTLDTIPLPSLKVKNNDLPYLSYKPGFLKELGQKIAENDSLKKLRHIELPEFTVTAKKPRRNLIPNKEINLNKTDPTGKKYGSLMQMIMQEFGEKAIGPRLGSIVIILNGASYERDSPVYSWVMSRPVNEISNVRFYEAASDMSLNFYPDIVGMEILFHPVVSLNAYANTYRGNPIGAVLIPFQGFYKAKEFYQPKHEAGNKNEIDTRATIYWNPELRTDSAGRAEASFYNTNLKGRALISVSGVSYQIKDAGSASSHYNSR